jgi:SAM-dependent methyltransferase
MQLLPDSIISHGVAKASGALLEGTCRVCGPTRFRSFAVKNGFNLGVCEQCEAVQVTDDLSAVNLADYYGQEFFDEAYGWLQTEGGGRRKEYRKFNYRLEEIEKLKPEKGRILDVGCSFGFFLDAARQRGWDTVGLDIGEYAAKFAREKLGLEVHVAVLADAPLEPGSFDAVAAWNLVEHLDDPVTELGRINALLRPGGIFVFTTGDVGSYMRRMQGLRWRSFIPPIHIVNYNIKAITKLLEKTGFRVEVRSVALPREAVLKQAGVIGLFKAIRLSDKMMIFARKVAEA